MPNITQELTKLRDRDTKHFETDVPGTYVAKCVLNQHFLHRESGSWEEIAYLTQPQPDGTYCTQARDVQFQVDPITGTYYIHHQDNTITFQPVSLCLYDPSSGLVQDLADVNPTPTFSFEGNRFTWVDIFPGVDLTLQLSEFQIQKRLVFYQRPTMPDLLSLGMNPDTTRLVVTFAGRSVTPVTLNQASTDASWSGAIQDSIYIDWGNGSRLTIPKAIGWGSGNRPPRGLDYIRDNVVNFGLGAPYNFVQAARYPIYIDPTVTLQPGVPADDATEFSNTTGTPPPVPTTYYSTQTDTAGLNYLTCGSYTSGGGKDPTVWGCARYLCRFNLNSIPFGSTMTSATLAMTVNTGVVNASLKTVDVIPNWSLTLPPGATEWSAASAATQASQSTAGSVESFVFTSGVQSAFGTYVAFRARYTNETTNTTQTTLYYGNGYPFDPTQRPQLSIVYTAPVNYPTATLVESAAITSKGTVNKALNLPVAVGDLLVLSVTGVTTVLPWAIPFSISDNLGNVWTQAFTTNGTSPTLTGTAAFFYSIVTVAGTPTISIASPGYNSLAWVILHFSGCTFTYDTLISFTNTNDATPWSTTASLTASGRKTLLIGGVGMIQGGSSPSASPMTFPPVAFSMVQAICSDTSGANVAGTALQYAPVGLWENPVYFNGSGTIPSVAVIGLAFQLSATAGAAGDLPRNWYIGS